MRNLTPLHHYTTTPLHHYTTTPLHHYVTTPLHHHKPLYHTAHQVPRYARRLQNCTQIHTIHTIQYNTIQYNTIQYCPAGALTRTTVRNPLLYHYTLLCNTALYFTVLQVPRYARLNSFIRYCTAGASTRLTVRTSLLHDYAAVLYNTKLYYTAGTARYFTVLQVPRQG